MATFDLPDTPLVEITFTLDDGTVMSRSGFGKVLNLTNVADPTWRVKIQTGPLDQAGRQIWTSWKSKLRGGLNRFSAYDVSRKVPLKYQGASSPGDIAAGWNGLGSVSAVGTGGAVTINGLPPGYQVAEGDRIALEKSGWTGYFEINTDAVANSSGVAPLVLSPFIDSYFSVGAVARLWRPRALFIIDWETWQHSAIAAPTPVSFEAYGVLK